MNRRKGILALLSALVTPMLNAQEEQSKQPETGSFWTGPSGVLVSTPPTVFGVRFSETMKSLKFTGDGRTVEITVKEIMDSLEAK